MSHSDACAEGNFAFRLDRVKFGQDASRIWCQCGQDLTVTAKKGNIKKYVERRGYLNLKTSSDKQCEMTLLCHSDEAHVVFWIASCFRVANDVDSILLSL